jgi:hypothetical protein
VAERLPPEELDAVIRAAAVAPLSPETVRQILEDHRELLAEWMEIEALVGHLMPLWRELRAVFNELAARVER